MNIRKAPWFTGRFFQGIGGPKWLQLCNTSFFGARKAVIEKIGGGFGPEYAHYWADDFLCYAVLDQGLDVRHFDGKFRCGPYFHEFQYDHTDVPDRRRHEDILRCDGAFLDSIRLINGGMSDEESVYLHVIAKSIPDGATITNVGVWRGSSAIVLLDALRKKRATFHFIDCFDLPGVSAMSAQPPATREDLLRSIQPYVGREHEVNVVQANTLELSSFPHSDFIFVDAGHTEECIEHDSRLARDCLTAQGIAAFHDYGFPGWPAVMPTLDRTFPKLDVYKTVAVYRRVEPEREAYVW
ncbi:MAG: hypothetical protein EXS05_16855 [Planctomycetaceae bacterium]|nr:hypothetical protein [Planctomycetaceae bacterium]